MGYRWGVGGSLRKRSSLVHARASMATSSTASPPPQPPASASDLMFGPYAIRWSEVFAESPSGRALALVNLKPLVPGHVLILPRRVVPRLAGLTDDEATDLFALVRRVQPVLERHYGATASTVAVQDGPDAGQSVSHVHVHILPRRPGDFVPNDKVYDALDGTDMGRPERPPARSGGLPDHGMDADEDRKPRTPDEMAAEAAELRALFDT